MTGEFRQRAHVAAVRPETLFVPSSVGVGVFRRHVDGEGALLVLHLLGKLEGDDERLSLMATLNVEQATGLMVQLRRMLLDAGVSVGELIAMMKIALDRIGQALDEDEAT